MDYRIVNILYEISNNHGAMLQLLTQFQIF